MLPKLQVEIVDGEEILVIVESDTLTLRTIYRESQIDQPRIPAGPLRLHSRWDKSHLGTFALLVNFHENPAIFDWAYLGELCMDEDYVEDDDE